jgi:hypothetical protein
MSRADLTAAQLALPRGRNNLAVSKVCCCSDGHQKEDTDRYLENLHCSGTAPVPVTPTLTTLYWSHVAAVAVGDG